MLHEIEEIDRSGLRKFGITTGIIVCVLFGLILPYLFGQAWPQWPWIVAAVLVVWALAIPVTLQPVYKSWMTIGILLGWINTRIILGVLFFIVFVPVALVLKIIGKDAMARKIHKPTASYRTICSNQQRDHFERPY